MPNDKYEDEIRDILNRMDRFIPDENQVRRQRKQTPPPWSGWMANFRRLIYTYNSTSFLVGWVVLALLAGVLHSIYPPFGRIAAILSVACLLAAIVLPMVSRRYGQPERRWRGRTIDYQPLRMRQPFSWRYVWWRIKSFLGWR